MKKIVSILLIALSGLMITGCSLPSAPEDDGPQFCVEKTIGLKWYDVDVDGKYHSYKSEFLRQTGCSQLKGCSNMAFIQVCE
ncbi:hypothetical protein [Fibrobacter sp. UBA2449]|uniref:hypothetical protein n=1 Tax=Fibrobacter sp. UBA2449 TaxID=1946529 RepID=UPI0025BC0FBB|nr:hypothetical protein [Fibrobacter sp. UBA2449]